MKLVDLNKDFGAPFEELLGAGAASAMPAEARLLNNRGPSVSRRVSEGVAGRATSS